MTFHRKDSVFLLIFLSVVALSAVIPSLFVSRQVSLLEAVEISKGTKEVKFYIASYYDPSYYVLRYFIKSNGEVYLVDENWKLTSFTENYFGRSDGKDHRCWFVIWSQSGPIPVHVFVLVDRDSGEILGISSVT
jgi:hypothetical protein